MYCSILYCSKSSCQFLSCNFLDIVCSVSVVTSPYLASISSILVLVWLHSNLKHSGYSNLVSINFIDLVCIYVYNIMDKKCTPYVGPLRGVHNNIVHSNQDTVHNTKDIVYSELYTLHNIKVIVHTTQYTWHNAHGIVHSTQDTVHCSKYAEYRTENMECRIQDIVLST